MDEYTKLAKDSVETYVKYGKKIEIPKNLSDEFYELKKGIFVTIYIRQDCKDKTKKQLRGCIGTFLPTKENIAMEIIDNAISSAVSDYRFSPIKENELNKLQYEVSVLEQPERVLSIKSLDPKKYGLILKSDKNKTGLLLPDIDGVETVKQQILITLQKAGIDLQKEKCELYRFTVEKHK